MCFAPQRHALFRQLNVQKWSVRTCRVFTILTTACTFSTSQRPKVLQQWCLLHILISKCASGHNGVQISSLISQDGSAPAAFASLQPTSRPSGATKHWKNTVFRPFHALASFFSSSLFSDSSHLCFSICPYCRKFDF